jgi:hypothetical protein
MSDDEQAVKQDVAKISHLNQIFEDVISDASDLIKDLYWSVKMYLFFGLITLLFGVQTLFYNMDYIQERHYIPLFITVIMIFAGSVQMIKYFSLRKKYSRLFSAQNEMKYS